MVLCECAVWPLFIFPWTSSHIRTYTSTATLQDHLLFHSKIVLFNQAPANEHLGGFGFFIIKSKTVMNMPLLWPT